MLEQSITLSGIDGANPLGFLAAVGALRLLDSRQPAARLHWNLDGGWRPVLSRVDPEPDRLVAALMDCKAFPAEVLSRIGSDLTVSREAFVEFVKIVEEHMVESGDRVPADFAAAFGSEAFEDPKKGVIERTDFCFITGSGHQHFVGTAEALLQQTTLDHLRRALFLPWDRADKKLSFRWDPADAAEYALRWSDPGPEGASSMWGANRLAIEALPLFPTHPTADGLATTAFRFASREDQFTWPVWTAPASIGTVRSLLSLKELSEDSADRKKLAAMGIAEVYRARRVRIGQGANFKVSFRPALSV
jgi:hypothetical protein